MSTQPIEQILAERAKTHGDFEVKAEIIQGMKTLMRAKWSEDAPADYYDLPASHREALEMIVHKIGRIITGDAFHKDHWQDVAGYATLILKEIEKYERLSDET